jgi:hypothetical protein
MHTNLVANEPTNPTNIEHPHYAKHLLFEDLSTFAYNDFNEVFDVNQIIQALK